MGTMPALVANPTMSATNANDELTELVLTPDIEAK